jgi:hypothetical protein
VKGVIALQTRSSLHLASHIAPAGEPGRGNTQRAGDASKSIGSMIIRARTVHGPGSCPGSKPLPSAFSAFNQTPAGQAPGRACIPGQGSPPPWINPRTLRIRFESAPPLPARPDLHTPEPLTSLISLQIPSPGPHENWSARVRNIPHTCCCGQGRARSQASVSLPIIDSLH